MAKSLNNVLKELKFIDGVSVKIGSFKGNGLWYCSKLCANIKKDIKLEYEKQREKELKQIKYYKKVMNNVSKHYKAKIDKWLSNPKIKKKSQEQIDNFIKKTLAAKERASGQLPRTIKCLEYDVKHPFLEREIIEIVDGISPDEPNTKVIYVKGYEHGDYWTLKEYQKAHLPRDKQKDFNERLPKLSEGENWYDNY